MAPVFKNYVFTINNPTTPVVFDATSHNCLIYQLERGESGTPHYQGYIEFVRRVSFTTAKESLGQNAHIEPRRGTRIQAIAYARKEDTRIEGPWEYGNLESTQGKRRDIHEFKEWYMSEKRTIDECVEYNPEMVAKYPRLITTLSNCFRRRSFTSPPPSHQTPPGKRNSSITCPPAPTRVKSDGIMMKLETLEKVILRQTTLLEELISSLEESSQTSSTDSYSQEPHKLYSSTGPEINKTDFRTNSSKRSRMDTF